jgi:4'-phosphopantetheinyl transferase
MPTRAPEVRSVFSAGGVEVLAASLAVSRPRLVGLAAMLTDDERRRASALARPLARRFAATRGLLRELLGARLATKPELVDLRVAPAGKLYAPGPVRFNVAHSADLAVFAFTLRRDVGVDVERVRALPAFERTAALALSPRENAELQELPEPCRLQAFFSCWTRKEAYLKARGVGLSIDPRHAAADGNRWALETFEPAVGFVGAVCTERAA